MIFIVVNTSRELTHRVWKQICHMFRKTGFHSMLKIDNFIYFKISKQTLYSQKDPETLMKKC